MINIHNLVNETLGFEESLRRLINDLATLQYNNAVREGGPNVELSTHYGNMMRDLRELDAEATRIRLGLGQAVEAINSIGRATMAMVEVDSMAEQPMTRDTAAAFEQR